MGVVECTKVYHPSHSMGLFWFISFFHLSLLSLFVSIMEKVCVVCLISSIIHFFFCSFSVILSLSYFSTPNYVVNRQNKKEKLFDSVHGAEFSFPYFPSFSFSLFFIVNIVLMLRLHKFVERSNLFASPSTSIHKEIFEFSVYTKISFFNKKKRRFFFFYITWLHSWQCCVSRRQLNDFNRKLGERRIENKKKIGICVSFT
jgi:hypothetical protein